jgi:hypothetical protein
LRRLGRRGQQFGAAGAGRGPRARAGAADFKKMLGKTQDIVYSSYALYKILGFRNEDIMVNKSDLTSTGVVIDGIELSNEERQPCEVWTRVMGYYRPVSFYNIGKKGEFHERVEFLESNCCLS